MTDSGSTTDDPGGTDDHSPAPTRVVLVRHGESIVTVKRVIGGHRSCTGLSDLGRRQSVRLRERLEATGEIVPTVLIASNFARAIETAEILAPAFGDREIEIDAGFGEHDPGPDLDGMGFDEYVRRFGRPDWGGDPNTEIFPGGETMTEFHHRVGTTLDRTVERHRGGTVVIACHGGVVDVVFRRALRVPITGSFDLWTLNTALTEFVLPTPADNGSARWRLVRYNDTSHLHGLPTATNIAEHA